MPSLSSSLLILDPGLGTSLTNPPHSYTFTSTTTPTWSSHLLLTSSGQAALLETHRSFIRAGAQVLLTGTYQASLEGYAATPTTLDGNGVSDEEAMRAMRKGVHLVNQAWREETGKEKAGLTALSLGAYGATLVPSAEYSGEYGAGPEGGLEEWHRKRVGVFVDDGEAWEGVDAVAFETVPRAEEVRAVRRVMGRLEGEGKGKAWWVCCVFPGEEGVGYRLPDETGVREVVQAMLGGDGCRPWGIGVNCTKIWKVRGLIGEFERAVEEGGFEWPRLVVYPDGAGDLVYDTAKQKWVPREGKREGGGRSWDEEMAEITMEVMARDRWNGVVVGGCCMTGPKEIEGLSRRLQRRSEET